MLYPRVRVYTLLPLGFIFTTIALPAWAMLLYWMALQIFGGLAQSVAEEGGGVAFWAHIGGFVAGVVLIKLFAKANHVVAHEAHHYQPRRVGWDYRDRLAACSLDKTPGDASGTAASRPA